jgi:transketolase
MLGDGELQEGQVWEAAMFAGHYRLSNLCAIIDYNKLQSDAVNEKIMGLEPLREKWQSFRWRVAEIDGHSFAQMAIAFAEARRCADSPTVIIAHTVKGKGVSFMERSPLWHGSVKLRESEFRQGLRELSVPDEKIGRCVDGNCSDLLQ